MNLLKDTPSSLLRHYLIPSTSATLVTSAYIIVDTIMIGRGVGADALVALNLVLPIFSLLFAIGMLFGVGGGVLYSVAHGAEDDQKANTIFSTALLCTVILGIISLLAGSIFLHPLCRFLGATNQNRAMVEEYAAYIVHFAPFFVFSTFLQAFVRNDHAPKRAMIGVLAGAISNILLDYIFIFPMHLGLTGGAIATVCGNMITVIILFTHFFSSKCTLRFQTKQIAGNRIGKILASGMPSALIEFATGTVIFCFNIQLLRYFGKTAIVVYGIITNCAIVCISLFNGVSQAAQPILSTNYGASQWKRVSQVFHLSARIIIVLGIFLTSTAFWMPNTLISLFVRPSSAITTLGIPTLRLYFLAFTPMSLNLLFCTYFQSIVKPIPSMILSLLRGAILPLGLVILLPLIFSGLAIWFVMPLTEFLTLFTACYLLRRSPLPPL